MQATSPIQPAGCRTPLQYSQLDAGHLSNTASWMQATIQPAGCRTPLQLDAGHLSNTASWMQDTSPIQPAGCRTPLQYSRNGGRRGREWGEERRGSGGRRVEGAGGGEGRAWGRREKEQREEGGGGGSGGGCRIPLAGCRTPLQYSQLDEGHLWSTIATKPYRSFVPSPFISSRAWFNGTHNSECLHGDVFFHNDIIPECPWPSHIIGSLGVLVVMQACAGRSLGYCSLETLTTLLPWYKVTNCVTVCV